MAIDVQSHDPRIRADHRAGFMFRGNEANMSVIVRWM